MNRQHPKKRPFVFQRRYFSAICGTAMLLLSLLFSCTITKRTHLPGWHVEWKKRLPESTTDQAAVPAASSVPSEPLVSGVAVPPTENADSSEIAAVRSTEQEHFTTISGQPSPRRTITRLSWHETIKRVPELPVVKKRTQAGQQQTSENHSGGFERFFLGLLLLLVLLPILILLLVAAIALFQFEYLLLGLLAIVLLIVLVVALIF